MHKIGVALRGLGVHCHQRARDWVYQDHRLQVVRELKRYVLDDSCSLSVYIYLIEVDGEVGDDVEIEFLTACGKGKGMNHFSFGKSELDLLSCLI